MNKITKTAAAALATLTIIVGSLGTTSQAQAFPNKKGLIGLGIAATVIGAVVTAATAPRCQDIQRFDRWGNYRGTVRVCE